MDFSHLGWSVPPPSTPLCDVDTVSNPAFPNLLIVGAPKTGTTSLYSYLKQHPHVFMSPIKEPCYFCSEMRPENFNDEEKPRVAARVRILQQHLRKGMPGIPPFALVTEWDDYQLLFRNVQAKHAVAGEASVFYLWSPSAPVQIRSKLPQAKLVVILRDPVERAFSHYLHCLSSGYIKLSFRDHIEKCLQNKCRKFGPLYPFLEFGLYHQQVKRYLDIFPRANIRTYWFEEAWANPQRFLSNVCEFLMVGDANFDTSTRHFERHGSGIRQFVGRSRTAQGLVSLIPRQVRAYLKPLACRVVPSAALDPRDRKYLVGYYRNDIEKLALLMNRDLSGWLRC